MRRKKERKRGNKGVSRMRTQTILNGFNFNNKIFFAKIEKENEKFFFSC